MVYLIWTHLMVSIKYSMVINIFIHMRDALKEIIELFSITFR